MINLPFFSALQTASWRGVPFGVTSSTLKVGRRNVVHEYPYRDDVWVEDLGRAGRRVTLTGFLVQDAVYGGGDVIAQRASMIAACEQQDDGAGELVHPSLGRLTVSLVDFECEEHAERGRVFELRFSFIESGEQQFPTLSIATQALTELSAVAAFAAAAEDFLSGISALLETPAIIDEVVGVLEGFVTQAQGIVQRATSLLSMVATLPGQFGRVVGQFTTGVTRPAATFQGQGTAGAGGSSVAMQSLIGAGATARAAVATCGTTLIAAASGSNHTGVASAAQSLVTAVRTANADPHQAVQSLLALRAGSSAQAGTTSALTTANTVTVALCRRSAVIALAQCTENYALTSFDDAQTLRTMVCDALDTEIVTAADAGEDATYNALRALKVAVVQDLTTRGASLAAMQTVTTLQPVPLIVLSQRLYQDIAHYDALVQQADPIHPAFSPTSFRASLA
ncbi:DNA circularization protein [Paraburkholderia sp. BR14262]|uniref:DNA circularization protein n=1 Tax=Paraburkholderia sp. BR14262 TaxID=3236999 RepID=UPI0034CDAAE2